MSLDHAILGFLNYTAQTGYDLKKTFDHSVRHFWAADRSQIYRTLARLTEQGYIEMEKVPQDGRPDRKLYHITPAGQAELRRWLASPVPIAEPHNAPLTQIFFSAQLTDEETLAKFESYAALLRTVLDHFDRLDSEIGPSPDLASERASEREQFFWRLTLEAGQVSIRANLEWVERVIKRIQNGQLPPR